MKDAFTFFRKRIVLLALSVCVCLAVVAAHAAVLQQTSPALAELDLPGFVAELDRLSAQVAELEHNPDLIPVLRRQIPSKWVVQPLQGEGARFEVATSWFVSALKDMETSARLRDALRRDILARLAALRGEALAYQGAAAAPVDDARVRLDEILSRREFRAVHGPTWWDLFRDRLIRWIAELLGKLLGPFRGVPRLGEALLWILIALVFVALALWIKRTWLHGRVEPGLQLAGARPEDRNWRHWAQEALAAAARGDYRDAVHRAYWAGVFRLEELGLWEPDRSRTPREYLRLVPSSHAHRAPLAALTQSFELTWYGRRPASSADFQQAVAHLENMGCLFPSKLATGKS